METQKKEREILDLKGRYSPVLCDFNFSARVFQVTRCSSCGLPLDLPTVHFMCKHSFHQRYTVRRFLSNVGVFLILMIQSVRNVQKKMQPYEIYDVNRMNGQKDRTYSVHTFEIQMINSVLWPIGSAREL